MNRILLAGLLSFALVPLTRAQDTPASDRSVVEKIKADPNDADALNDYLGQSFLEIRGMLDSEPDAAEQKLKALSQLLATLKPDDEKAARLVAYFKRLVSLYEDRLALARTTTAELEQKLKGNPNDVRTISQYTIKVTGELRDLALTHAEAAETKLHETTKFLTALKDNTDNEATAQAIDRAANSLKRVESHIRRHIKIGRLVGTDAPDLEGVAWVNGTPLTPDDLHGKVVLLDFWAVWCGPCIATFPNLIEWHEKYADEGLVIIGVTRYYRFVWDDAAGRAVRSEEEVTPQQEQAMLEKFAEQHRLQHRFLLEDDRDLSKHFAVSGIPHVALIDRNGKVRLVRVGAGPANAKDISEMLEKLMAEGA